MKHALNDEAGQSHGEADPKISVICPRIVVKLKLSLFMAKLLSPHVDEITGLEIRHIVLERTTLNDSSEVVVRHKNEEYTNRDK